MVILCLIVSLLVPNLAFAAYQNPQIVSNTPQANGAVKLVFAFSGNAGEPTVQLTYLVQHTTTVQGLRNWIDETMTGLDLVRTAGTLPALQPGQTINRLASTPSVKPAVRVWAEKMEKYLRVKDAGVTAMTADLATLKADLEATYQAGYLLQIP